MFTDNDKNITIIKPTVIYVGIEIVFYGLPLDPFATAINQLTFLKRIQWGFPLLGANKHMHIYINIPTKYKYVYIHTIL